jgi:hypothetical protein
MDKNNIKNSNIINKQKDIDRIFDHNNVLKLIPFIIGKQDIGGYVYCVENKLFDGYSEPVYKISSTISIENMLNDHNTTYFQETLLVRKIRVPRKLFYEYMLILRLNKQRIKSNKNFYINLKEINKAFDELEQLLKNKSENDIHEYYLNFMADFKKSEYCSTLLKITKRSNYLPEIKLTKKKSMKINLNSDNSGYIYWIEHPYIKEYFNDKIQIIIPSVSPDVPWIKSNFIEDIQIIKVLNVKYLDIAKNMLYELGYLYNIKSCYYIIPKDLIIEIFELIDKYFKTYGDKFQLNFAFGQRKFNLKNNQKKNHT